MCLDGGTPQILRSEAFLSHKPVKEVYMTNPDRSMNTELFQSLFTLRSSIDALYCAAELLPRKSDLEPVADLFQILAERLQGDLVVVFASVKSLDRQSVSS